MTPAEKIEKLEREIAELKKEISKPRFEVGKWYKSGESISNYQGKGKSFGFSYNGEWVENNYWFDVDNGFCPEILAAPEEVYEALIKEAEKRGYKEGVIVTSFKGLGASGFSKNYRTVYNSATDTLTFLGTDIYRKGQWAEIIKENPIMIGSYNVKFNSDSIQVGCQTVSKETIEKILAKFK